MTTGMLRRRTAIWIACFAILLNALAPVASRALAAWSESPTAWTQIRATGGFAHLPGPDAPAHDHDHSQPVGDSHCPFCLVHAGSFGLAAQVPAILAVAAPVDPAPAIGRIAPPPRGWYTSAQPRAPPSRC